MAEKNSDMNQIKLRYEKQYREHGYSPKTLGWDKGKQSVRFDVLSSQYKFDGKHILDIGCGFGDLNQTISNKADTYRYTGVELTPSLIEEARQRYPADHIEFICADILEFKTDMEFDYTISSGIFNLKFEHMDNYGFIEKVMTRAFEMSKDGLAFDFLSDKVDYEYEHTFHSSPEKILSMAYQLSRNVVLRNDYQPFEFSLFIFKDDSFEKVDTLFNRFKTLNQTSD